MFKENEKELIKNSLFNTIGRIRINIEDTIKSLKDLEEYNLPELKKTLIKDLETYKKTHTEYTNLLKKIYMKE